jgi:hypothetical protein
MQWTIPMYGHRFCSQACIRQYEQQEWIVSSQKELSDGSSNERIAYLLIAVILIGGVRSRVQGWMIYFMGCFFVIVALLKLLDLPWFVEAYGQYDLIAMQYRWWWWVYPFVELLIGVLFLLTYQVEFLAGVTLILMIIGTVGVSQKLLADEQFRCACLGTTLDIPLTSLTLVEDLLMAVMSVMILVGGI